MPKGGFDPAWPLLDPQQQSQCYPQFSMGRPGQISNTKGAFPSSHLKTPHMQSNATNSSGTLNRSRPCTQMRHRPWSPPGVDHFGRHIPLVIKLKTYFHAYG